MLAYCGGSSSSVRRARTRWCGVVLWLSMTASCCAFPPAPMLTLTGTVKDEFGDPWRTGGATVTILVEGEAVASGEINPDLSLTRNYRLRVPMDSGLTESLYRASALVPFAEVQVSIRSGGKTYVPIEAAQADPVVPEIVPGSIHHVNLTVGEDSDLDGLPDLWEEWQLATDGLYRGMPGFSLDLVAPDGDNDHDGVPNYTEYLAGTLIFSAFDTFALQLVDLDLASGTAHAAFLAVTGRAYAIESSTDMKTWTRVQFRPGSPTAEPVSAIKANDVIEQSVYVPAPGAAMFYRVRLLTE